MRIKGEGSEKLEGRKLEILFRAYFNNKMTILLMMIEQPEAASRILSAEKQKSFLHDLEHHFLGTSHPKYHHAFKWLQCFLTQYPDITCEDVYTAIKMVKVVHEAFGFELPPRLEERRLERERLGRSRGKRKDMKETTIAVMKRSTAIPINKTLGWGLNVYGLIFKFYMLAIFAQQRKMEQEASNLARRETSHGRSAA